MTTNTNRTVARFFAATAPANGRYAITDRTDGTIVALVVGRAAARSHAAMLTTFDPAPRPADDAKPAKKAKKAKPAAKPAAKAERTSHADCAHASTKLARAICRRERSKAATA